jgi:hypothetical protein
MLYLIGLIRILSWARVSKPAALLPYDVRLLRGASYPQDVAILASQLFVHLFVVFVGLTFLDRKLLAAAGQV